MSQTEVFAKLASDLHEMCRQQDAQILSLQGEAADNRLDADYWKDLYEQATKRGDEMKKRLFPDIEINYVWNTGLQLVDLLACVDFSDPANPEILTITELLDNGGFINHEPDYLSDLEQTKIITQAREEWNGS